MSSPSSETLLNTWKQHITSLHNLSHDKHTIELQTQQLLLTCATSTCGVLLAFETLSPTLDYDIFEYLCIQLHHALVNVEEQISPSTSATPPIIPLSARLSIRSSIFPLLTTLTSHPYRTSFCDLCETIIRIERARKPMGLVSIPDSSMSLFDDSDDDEKQPSIDIDTAATIVDAPGWPTLVPELVSYLSIACQKQHYDSIISLLMAACAIINTCKGSSLNVDIRLVDRVITDIHPLVTPLFQQLMSRTSHTWETYTIMHLCMKLFCGGIYKRIPTCYRSAAAMKSMIASMLYAFLLPVPSTDIPPIHDSSITINDDDRHNHALSSRNQLLKMKKWITRAFIRLLERYTLTDAILTKQDEKQLQSAMKQEYILRIVDTYLEMFRAYNATSTSTSTSIETQLSRYAAYWERDASINPVLANHPLTVCLILKFLTSCLVHDRSLSGLIHPHLPFILTDCIYPCMYLRPSTQYVWHDKPKEYIKHKYALFSGWKDTTLFAGGLLQEIVMCKPGRPLLPIVFDTINAVCIEYVKHGPVEGTTTTTSTSSSLHPIVLHKEAALHMLGLLRDQLTQASTRNMTRDYMPSVLEILDLYVYPELTSSYSLLRGRSIWLVGQWCQLIYNQPKQITYAHVVTECCNVMIHDQHLPVRVEAARALKCLVTDDPAFWRAVTPIISDVITALLNIADETDSEQMIATLTRLISRGGAHVLPLTHRLCDKLSNIAYAQLDTLNSLSTTTPTPSSADEDDSVSREDTCLFLIAESCNGLHELCNVCAFEEASVLETLYAKLHPLLIRLIASSSHPHPSLHESFAELLEGILRDIPHIQQDMWILFPQMCEIMIKEGNTEELVVYGRCLYRFIARDSAHLIADESLLRMLIQIVDMTLSESDHPQLPFALSLIECLAIQTHDPTTCVLSRDILDSLLKQLLRLVDETHHVRGRMLITTTICACLYHHVHTTYQLLVSHSALSAVLEVLQYNLINTTRSRIQRKILSLGISSVCAFATPSTTPDLFDTCDETWSEVLMQAVALNLHVAAQPDDIQFGDPEVLANHANAAGVGAGAGAGTGSRTDDTDYEIEHQQQAQAPTPAIGNPAETTIFTQPTEPNISTAEAIDYVESGGDAEESDDSDQELSPPHVVNVEQVVIFSRALNALSVSCASWFASWRDSSFSEDEHLALDALLSGRLGSTHADDMTELT